VAKIALLMPKLDANTLKVMRVLESHPGLDSLEIASRAEVSVSEAELSLRRLRELGLLTGENIYSLNGAALSSMLEAA
jgi:predicted transcriptional regulator